MKTKSLILAVSVLVGTSAFAEMTVDLGKLKEKTTFLRTNIRNECKDFSKVMKTLTTSLSKEQKAACGKSPQQFVLQYCQTKFRFLRNIEKVVKENEISSVSKNLGDGAPEDAVAAVLNWKVDRLHKELESDVKAQFDRVSKNAVCELFKNRTASQFENTLKSEVAGIRSFIGNVAEVSAPAQDSSTVTSRPEVQNEPTQADVQQREALELELHRAGVQ